MSIFHTCLTVGPIQLFISFYYLKSSMGWVLELVRSRFEQFFNWFMLQFDLLATTNAWSSPEHSDLEKSVGRSRKIYCRFSFYRNLPTTRTSFVHCRLVHTFNVYVLSYFQCTYTSIHIQRTHVYTFNVHKCIHSTYTSLYIRRTQVCTSIVYTWTYVQCILMNLHSLYGYTRLTTLSCYNCSKWQLYTISSIENYFIILF